MTVVAPSVLVDATTYVLERAGADPDIAREVADNLVDADLAGHSSHGTRLLGTYVGRLKDGSVQGRERPVVTSDNGPVVRVDARRAFGQIAGAFAVAVGVEAAARHGIAMVATLNSGHFGRNGRWPELAAAAQMASLHFVNLPGGVESLVPFGAREPRLTSNPMAIGAPNPGGPPLVLDFAIGEYASNAVRAAAERGEKLARDCIVRPDGTLSNDPADYMRSRAMLPFGGFKGYGIGFFTELLAGALTGGGCKTSDSSGPSPTSNMLSIFISTTALASEASYGDATNALVAWIGSATPADPASPVLVPGQRGHDERKRHLADGLHLDAVAMQLLRKAAAGAGALEGARQGWPALFI